MVPLEGLLPHRHGRHSARFSAASSKHTAQCAGTGAVGTPAVRVRIKGEENENPQLAPRTCRFRAPGEARTLTPTPTRAVLFSVVRELPKVA
jgi:hypothetical protein